MKPAEVKHYAAMLASLTVTAARASSAEALLEVHDALAETFEDALMLLAHDAEKTRALERDRMTADLLAGSSRLGVRT